MNNRIEVIRGLFNYNYYTYKLRDSEHVPGVWKNAILMILLSGLIFGISSYFGIGSEYLSKKLTSISREEYEMQKLLFMAGQTVLGLFFGFVLIFLPALFFWTLSDLELKKLLAVQLFVMPIFLLEKVIIIPFAIFLAVGKQEYVAFSNLVATLGLAMVVLPLVSMYGLVGAAFSAIFGNRALR